MDTLTWQLAFRYLRGKRSANAVPILSRISMVAIAVSSAAMIVVFSVFNGLEATVKDMYKAFYPDIRISVVKGKFFKENAVRIGEIRKMSGVNAVTEVIEDNGLVNENTNKEQKVITLKGINNDYFDVNDAREYVIAGVDSVSTGHPYTAIAGKRILNELGADINNVFSSIEVYYLNPTVTDINADPASAYQVLKLHPAGVFNIQDEFDGKYILAPLSLAQQLFHQEGYISSIELSADPAAVENIKKQLQQLFGDDYRIETRYEQNRTMYMVMGGEKWAVYAILLLVLLIASFNMVGALSMLVLEKRKDIGILRAMGALPGTIRKIFLLEGMLWSLVGGFVGITLGVAVCLAQQTFGFIKLGGSFMIDAYPVKINIQDLLLVITTIMAVGLLAAWYPAVRATKAIDPTLKST